MKKTILTILGSAVVAATTVQFAAAAERHHIRKADRLTAPASGQFRNSNAAWPSLQPDWSRYSGGYSAPAGR
jgi:hypothetical protein